MFYKYRKLILIVILVLVVTIPAIVYINYLNSIQKVTFTFDTTYIKKVDIHNGDVTTGTSGVLGSLSQTVENGKSVTMKKGVYTLKPIGDNIKDTTVKLVVGDTPVTQNVTADYSEKYLASLLPTELPLILASLNRDSPKLKDLYSLNEGKLYGHGEWFGSTLNYIGTESLRRDNLRFVMKKVDNNWILITNPPQITLSAKEYPQIPHDVLSKVNYIDLGLPVLAN